MHGDFARDIFDPAQHYSRVLMQQGRVLVGDDWNLQSAIHLHYLRALAKDLIGQHGGPFEGNGFNVTPGGAFGPFKIEKGHYYVDGILCENESEAEYRSQPSLPTRERPESGTYLVYLDVWERHLTHLDDSLMREVALGGPDTTTRAQVVWQVKLHKLAGALVTPDADTFKDIFEKEVRPVPTPKMSADAARGGAQEGPCTTAPDARYRRAENQLYRVEIHRGGTATRTGAGATFKWSRDNGARAVYPLRTPFKGDYFLTDLGRDDASRIAKDDWVELTDDDYEMEGRNDRPLLQVATVDDVEMRVTLSGSPGTVNFENLVKPRLRRWDQTSADQALSTGDIAVVEEQPIDIEDGVQILFDKGGRYHPGMYWLIPARVETGDIEWPFVGGKRALREPHGVEHHFAPLAEITVVDGNVTGTPVDHRCRFRSLCEITKAVAF